MPTKIDFIGGNTKRCLIAEGLPRVAGLFPYIMYNPVDRERGGEGKGGDFRGRRLI